MKAAKTQINVQVKDKSFDSLDELLNELENLWKQVDKASDDGRPPANPEVTAHSHIPTLALAFVIGAVTTLIILYTLSVGFGFSF